MRMLNLQVSNDSLGGQSRIKQEPVSAGSLPQMQLEHVISIALQQVCNIQLREFALIVADHEGSMQTYTSPSIKRCEMQIFPKRVRDAFMRAIAPGNVNEFDGDLDVKEGVRNTPAADETECISSARPARGHRAATPSCVSIKRTPIGKERAEASRRQTNSAVKARGGKATKPRKNAKLNSDEELPKHKALMFGDKDEVCAYFADAFSAIQQLGCKVLAKAWIKEREPKKQSRYPYKDGPEPPWWPPGIIHKEPDHISKEARTVVLTTIMLDPETDLDQLKTMTEKIDHAEINHTRKLLAEMFRVAKLHRDFNDPNKHFDPQTTTPVTRAPKSIVDPKQGKMEGEVKNEEENSTGQETTQTPLSSMTDGSGQSSLGGAPHNLKTEESPSIRSTFGDLDSPDGSGNSMSICSQTPLTQPRSIYSPSSAHSSELSHHRSAPSYVGRGIVTRQDALPMSTFDSTAFADVQDIVMASQPPTITCHGRQQLAPDNLGPSHNLPSNGLPQSVNGWQPSPQFAHGDYSCGPCDASTIEMLSPASMNGYHQASHSHFMDESMALQRTQSHQPQMVCIMDPERASSMSYFGSTKGNYYRHMTTLGPSAADMSPAGQGFGYGGNCQ